MTRAWGPIPTFKNTHIPNYALPFHLQAENKDKSLLAAAKVIDVNDETELDDFMVEIDILSECKHKHVVGMHEAYYYDNKLWVSNLTL